MNSILIRQATKKGYAVLKLAGVANLSLPTSSTRRGRVIDEGRVCSTIMTSGEGNFLIEESKMIYETNNRKYNLRIRKFTPRECWRLMGFSDGDYDKAAKVCSETQLYKQAGNSIVVPVLESVFRSIFRSVGFEGGKE